DGNRLTTDRLDELVGVSSLRGWHVATCGPTSLIGLVAGAAGRLGAGHIETEAFDIRSGIGPDLSRPIDDAIQGRRGAAGTSSGQTQPAGPVMTTVDPPPENRKPASTSSH
ncbi:MAG: hypothetical protein AAFO29_13275, partial [Actinomycetota bacterium]